MGKKAKRIIAVTSAIAIGIMAKEASAQENLNLKDNTEIIKDNLEDGSFAAEDILNKINESTSDAAVKMVTKNEDTLKPNDSASPEEETTNPDCFSVTDDGHGNVTIIGYNKSENTSPEVVIIPSIINGKNVVGIENEAFKGCAEIKTIIIPEGVTSIGYRAFHDCTGITTIKMPNSLTSIGQEAFRGCKGIKTLTIPEGVTSIGDDFYKDCSYLENIEVSEDNTAYKNIDDALFTKDGKTLIKFPSGNSGNEAGEYKVPEGVVTLGKCAFADNAKLKNVIISDEVTTIGDLCFSSCTSLERIEIPPNVKKISISAFQNCNNVSEAIVPIIPPGLSDEEKDDMNGIGTIVNGYNTIQYDNTNGMIINKIGKNWRGTESIKIPSKIFGKDVTEINNIDSGIKTFQVDSKSILTMLKNLGINTSTIEIIRNDDDLQDFIKDCEDKKYNEGEYTQVTFTEYEQALKSAKELLLDSERGQKEIDETLDRLKKAENKLKEEDKKSVEELERLYEKYKDVQSENYTADSGEALKEALKKAGEVLKNNNAAHKDVNEALKILKEAADNLSEVDKKSLEELYEKYKDVQMENYTADSYAALNSALEKAKEVISDKNAVQEQVNDALKILKEAGNNLSEVDKKSLEELYERYKDVQIGNYTADSYAAFKSALIDAEKVLSDGNAVQKEVDDAENNLKNAAEEGLKEKQSLDNQNNSGGSEDSSTENNSSSNSSSSSSSHKSSGKKSTDSENSDLITMGNTKADLEILDKKEYKDDVIENDMTYIGLDDNIESIYKINNDDFKGNVVKFTKNIDGSVNGNNNYLYIKCDNTKIDMLKVNVSSLINNGQIYVYEFDSLGKPVLAKLVDKSADNTIYINVKNKSRYLISDKEINIENFYKEGWNKVGDNWIYIRNAQIVTGWLNDTDGKWYYMNSEGIMQTRWIKDNEKWYYLSNSGAMSTGWIKDNGKWYYLSSSGAMSTGWLKDVDEKWYYLNEDGEMLSDTTINGYKVGADGAWIK